MPNETRDQDELPHAETDLDPPVTHTSRRRPTSDKSQSSHDRGLVVTLWLFALLIAEIEFWMLAFAHMYRM